MKVSLLAIVFILAICSTSALSTDIKENYERHETMIIRVIGDIVEPISADQVIFKRNNIFIPLEYDVQRIGDTWYVWAIAPQTEGNYTLILEDIVTGMGSGVEIEQYEKEFSVFGESDYNIKPGFITTSEDFSVEINLFSDSETTIETDFPEDREINLEPGNNNLDFQINEKSTGEYSIKIGKYTFPAFITTDFVEPVNNTNQTQTPQNTSSTNSTAQNSTVQNNTQTVESYLSIEPTYIQRLIYKDAERSTYNFTIRNIGDKNYKNIQITYNEDLFEIEDSKFDIKANGTYSFIVELGEYPGDDVREIIYINATNMTLEIPFFVRYTENASEIAVFYGEIEKNSTSNITRRKTNFYCSELGGIVCSTQSQCSGESLTSREGSCCLGICKQPENSGGSIWGWIIGILALGIIAWMYMRYKKAGENTDLLSKTGLNP